MTGVTYFTGKNVAAGFVRLTSGDSAIVTTLACTHGFVVVDRSDRHPRGASVTGLAHITGQNMSGIFARGTCAIVTSGTAFSCGGVIKHRHKPVRRVVAHLAGCGGRNVVDTFTNTDHAVMTRLASTIHLCVIDQRINRYPGRGYMAGFAQVRRIDMRC